MRISPSFASIFKTPRAIGSGNRGSIPTALRFLMVLKLSGRRRPEVRPIRSRCGFTLRVTDVRSGTTTYSYFDDDQIHTVTTPDPDTTKSGDGYDPQTTTYAYDSAGRVETVTHPDGGVVSTTYWTTGQVKRTWGSRTYPVEYTYDPQGRTKTLTTWQDFTGNAGKAVTIWNYNSVRGWLDNKRYNDETGPSYTYWPSGRLHTRVWARTPAITTTYTYNVAGDLGGTDYSDSTPDVTILYNRSGQPKTITDGSGTRALTYDASEQLKDEDYTAGALANFGVHRTFDSQARLSGVSVLGSPSSVLNSVGYSYDAASRLDTVTQGANTATYGYVSNAPMLVQTITFNNGTVTRLITTKSYDNLNRLASISNSPSAGSVQSVLYQYNSANQRTRATREDSGYWSYGYDTLGQVTSGKKYLSTDTPINGLDYAWTYDDIGNRKTSVTNGKTATFTPNLLNQYEQRSVPGAIDVLGEAAMNATVTLQTPASSGSVQSVTRQSGLFYKQLTVDNSTTAQNPSIKVTGVKNLAGTDGEDAITTVTKTSYVAKTPEIFTHDADGNLTDDARWHYTWDGENRLAAMETSAAAIGAGVAKLKLEFAYDSQGRRFSKSVSSWNGTAWVLGTSTRFLYDGWNLLAEIDATGSAQCTYAWGLDLSGSLQGAGGVGGLLFVAVSTPSASFHAPGYDGNGNVIAGVDMASGAISAKFEYNAFGQLASAEGVATDQIAFQFSTKYSDAESGQLYYGLRYYSPSTGRWINRDPIDEQGGVNLYGMVSNNPINVIDPLGAKSVQVTVSGTRTIMIPLWGKAAFPYKYEYKYDVLIECPSLKILYTGPSADFKEENLGPEIPFDSSWAPLPESLEKYEKVIPVLSGTVRVGRTTKTTRTSIDFEAKTVTLTIHTGAALSTKPKVEVDVTILGRSIYKKTLWNPGTLLREAVETFDASESFSCEKCQN